MTSYKAFIPENTALSGAIRIGIYNQNGLRVGHISPGNLLQDKGRKRYAFGALADVHMQYETAPENFRRVLTYLNDTADFVCVCGDLTTSGTGEELSAYRQHVDQYARIPVYTIAGNHEGNNSEILSILEDYTGKPLYFSFPYGDDVFIMVGVKSNVQGQLFAEGELQWLYETLEANRNKRCFVFQHVYPKTGSLGLHQNSIWGGTEAAVFTSLMQHYPNVVLFHGHSHLCFDLQEKYGDDANYDKTFGCHSVHIPAIASPTDADGTEEGSVRTYAESEGYVVDVYDRGIHLRGRDFAGGTFLPIASYWLDTTLKTVEAGMYTDSTGTIHT